MTPNLIKFAIATMTSILLFSSGWTVRGWKFDAEMRATEQATNAAYRKAVEDAGKTSAALDVVLSKLEANKFITVKETSHEILKPVYSDCVLPISGVRLYNKSASTDTSESAD